MKAPSSLAGGIVLATAVAACTPHAGIMPFYSAPLPAAGPALPASVGAPAQPEAGSPAPASPRTVIIRAAVNDSPLAGAAVTVRRVQDLAVVAEGLVLGADGKLTLPLTDALKAGTVVVISARTGQASLSGLYTVPAAAFALKQTNENTEWLLDLATSAVTRKLTSKLADVERSLPAGQRTGAVQALMARLDTLVRQARDTLRAGLRDRSAGDRAATQPTAENIEDLANQLVVDSPLQAAFVSLVEDCNREVVNNMVAGGPLVIPSPWQILNVVVPPPELRLNGAGRIEVSYAGETKTLEVPDAEKALAEARKATTATTADGAFAEVNTTVVTPPTTSSGSGSRSTSKPPSITGIVRVAGVPRARALVQLRTLSDNAFVADMATLSDGLYAFYDIPAGTYHLIVAVDGVVQSTTIVTIGN